MKFQIFPQMVWVGWDLEENGISFEQKFVSSGKLLQNIHGKVKN